MAYSYLLDLYKVLEKRKSLLIKSADNLDLQDKGMQQLRGQLSVIDDFTKFLRQNYHHRLPRRLQKE